MIGYYLALRSQTESPPLVFVLSERDIDIVMFPFVKDRFQLVNGVRFPEVKFWKTRYLRDFDISAALAILYMVLKVTITKKLTGCFVEYKYDDRVKKRNLIDCVTSESNASLQRVKMQLQQTSDALEE